MAVRDKLLDFLFYFLVGTLYAYALSRAIMAATILEFPQTSLLLLCAVFMLMFYVVFLNRYTLFSFLVVFVLGILIVYLYLRSRQFQVGWFMALQDYVDELVLFAREVVPYREEYNLIIAAVIAFSFCFLTSMNIRIHFNFVLLLLMGFAVMAVPIYMDWGSSPLAVVLTVFCLVVFFTRRMNMLAGGGGQAHRPANAAAALAAIPLCVLVFLASAFLPKPELAQESEGIRQYVTDTADNVIYDVRPDQIMSYSQDGQRLGGPIALNDQPVMEVYAQDRLYLSGSVRDTYTGSAWTAGVEEKEALEPDEGNNYRVSKYDAGLISQQDYYRRFYGWGMQSVTVNIGENRTRALFSPPYAADLWISKEVELAQNQFGNLSVRRPLDIQTSYTQEYIAWNYHSGYFVGLLRTLSWEGEAGMDAYLALPDEMPRRVGELAEQLTRDQTNDYDKIKALEAYLASFPYTLEPSAVPRDADFVDYFLFEGQEGYCTYFASALAVMGRSVGIPTRYVEGFVMPTDKNANGGYTVTNRQAHAWTEVYFSGLGWVTFEPTPPNYRDLYSESPGEAELVVPELPEESVDDGADSSVPESPIGDQDSDAPGGAGEGDVSPGSKWGMGVAVVLLLLCAAAGGIYAMVYWYRRKLASLDRLDNRAASIAYFTRILRAAGLYGYPVQGGDTAHSFAQRVGTQLTFQHQTVELEQLSDIYAKAAFSKEPVTDGERETVKRCYIEMIGKLREYRLSNVAFFVNRYLLRQF